MLRGAISRLGARLRLHAGTSPDSPHLRALSTLRGKRSSPTLSPADSDDEEPLRGRDPEWPPRLLVVQPRLRPGSLLDSNLAETRNLANSLEEPRDSLFATVDPRLQSVILPSGRKALLSDTVGFVSNRSTVLKSMLNQSWKRGAHVLRAGNSAPALFTCWSQFHSGQVLSSSRSFFGVEDFVDEDNSRPYTYKKEKRSKNPHKHISFKQRTIAYMEPFTLDVFISKRFVSASLTHRSTCRQVAVAGTNSKDIKAVLKSRSDIPACLAVGRFLAERAKEADVYTCTYTPRERDKFEGKIRAVVQSLIDSGINVKLYLD